MKCTCTTTIGLPCKNNSMSNKTTLCSINYRRMNQCHCKTKDGKICKNNISKEYAPYCSQAHKNNCLYGLYETAYSCSRNKIDSRRNSKRISRVSKNNNKKSIMHFNRRVNKKYLVL